MISAQVPLTHAIVLPGEVWFGGGSTKVSTLLGSCVAFTVWHPRLRTGGMCHYLLPGRRPSGWDGREEPDGRYADEAFELLRRRMAEIGTTPAEYQIRVFGGGSQFGHLKVARPIDVPRRNVEAGLALLQAAGVRPIEAELGGHGPRHVLMHIDTGAVEARRTTAMTGE